MHLSMQQASSLEGHETAIEYTQEYLLDLA